VTAITGIAAQNKTYDNSYGAALTTGGAGFTGKVTGDTLAVASSTGTFSDKNVANNIPVSITGLTLGGTDASNYNLTTNTASSSANITARPITVTANSGQTKVYGNADPTLTYTLEANSAGHGLVVGDTFSGALSRASGENVGSSYAITQGTLTNSNYAISFTGANFAITQRPITVAIDAKTKVYGNTDPTLTYSLSSGNLVGGDALTLSRVVGENVGSYAISAANGNYAITANSANLSITARPITITANSGQSKVYGNTDPTLTYTLEANSAGRGLVGSDAFSGALGRASGENVGSSYAITQGTLANSNYAISLAAGGSFAITQRPITVVIDAKSKVYGNTDPTLSYSITSGNLFGSDALTLSRVSGENVGSYAISAVNSNYAITANSANLGITARPIIVTANSGLTKVYGNADPTLSYTLEANSSGRGLVGSDTFSGALSRTSGENVASSYTITQGTLANSNYAISLAAGGSFAITQRPITLAMDAKNKRSGDPDPSWTYQLTNGNLVTGDALTLSRVTGDAPGLYLISAANPNYLITATNAYLTVLPKAESPTLVNGLLTVAPVQPASQPSSAPAVTPQKVVVNASNELANPLPTVQASNGLMLIPVAHEQVRALTEDSTSRSADTNANASAKPVAWLQSAQTLGYTGVLVVEGGVNLPAGIR
jgi:hypothetical protein